VAVTKPLKHGSNLPLAVNKDEADDEVGRRQRAFRGGMAREGTRLIGRINRAIVPSASDLPKIADGH